MKSLEKAIAESIKSSIESYDKAISVKDYLGAEKISVCISNLSQSMLTLLT